MEVDLKQNLEEPHINLQQPPTKNCNIRHAKTTDVNKTFKKRGVREKPINTACPMERYI